MSGTPDAGADPGDELVDIVDEDDVVVATVTRREMRARRLRHRAVFIVVTSTSGALLVHRRSDDKDLWPGRWDVGVGGVVGAGESYEVAAERELAEEVGVVGVRPVAFADGRFADVDVDLVARAFRVVHDGPFRFADGEVVEARWVDADGLAELMAGESFVPDSLALLPVDVLFPDRFPFPAPGDPQGR